MKKLIISAALMLCANWAFSQSYYYRNQSPKNVSFQVAPTVANYDNSMLIGASIGVNVNERFNLSYFHTRDYDFSETYMDNRWAGLYAAMVFPINDCFDLGPAVRLNTFNGEWKKVFVGAELRVDLGWNTKLGFEYGMGEKAGGSLKLIWNIY
ncbi:hypothetical protein BXY85_2952 [Roseivirga pacifica]|uniref:Outer membrane protein beta-barrel domain-containing protein n=1 Tax=Roseivirga pacifica TaxID=1267423 RepID=A0A1I0QY98_9BACT|nr:hypothetical protein [Roseivirga pacifica]RKQ42345.1 hypothetical protein BXY85_2952 [Roseivirga pacifica]SEW32836.1 hypothetical protein SAMN05216290_2920 [Roseivirga pacifica]